MNQDQVTWDTLKSQIELQNVEFRYPVVCFMEGDSQWITSTTFHSGIPSYSLKINKELSYESYHLGIECTITSLTKNRVQKLSTWSKVHEALRFLHHREKTRHQEVLVEQISNMAPPKVGKKLYSPETMMRAFGYYSCSRSLYGKLRKDFKLPSIKTLSSLTSKVNKLSDQKFINQVFGNLEERQKKCIILIDEMYLKKMLLYHGGKTTGKAENKPELLANAVLTIMVKCLFGGPTFVFKSIPVTKMDASFLFDQVSDTIDIINQAGGSPVSIICDDNRTNQKFFKSFETVANKPWLTTSGIFLLFDFVHLIKSIRNNWLTEVSSELSFLDDKIWKVAKWKDLLDLFECEPSADLDESGTRGLSKLNEVSVKPKPIERQKVSTCLRVFCEETSAALRTHPGLEGNTGAQDTAKFIEKVTEMWKILNVRSKYKDVKHNNPLEAVIESPDDPRLTKLLELAEEFKKMGKGKGGKRVRKLTIDTSKALHHTLNGLVELCRQLLATGHKFVMIGEFNNDPIEGNFGQDRQGSGGTYFISAQQVLEKLDIKKTKLLLELNATEILDYVADVGHHCSKCGYWMDEKVYEVFDNLPQLEDRISTDNKMSLVHVAGYVTRKDLAVDEDELLETTTFYYQKYGKYTDIMDRGGLNVPSDTACQWVFFCYLMFNAVKHNVCRTSLSNIFMQVAEMHSFNMSRTHARILSNVFFNNHCRLMTPRSTKESKQKVLKLSEDN